MTKPAADPSLRADGDTDDPASSLLYVVRWCCSGSLVFMRDSLAARAPDFPAAGEFGLYLTLGLVVPGAVLLASTLMNFSSGRWMQPQALSSRVLWTGLCFNWLLLAVSSICRESATSLPFASLQKFSHLALPLGISFWTFQAMSYLLRSVSRRRTGSDVRGVRAVHGVLPGGDFRPDLPHAGDAAAIPLARAAGRNDIARGICRIATGLLMMQIAQLLGKGILSGQGINAGFDQIRGWSGPTCGVWRSATGCKCSSISPATRTLPSAPPACWASRCRKISRGRSRRLRRRSSGRAGTCRCRSGFATTSSCRWRCCAAKSGGESFACWWRWCCSASGTRHDSVGAVRLLSRRAAGAASPGAGGAAAHELGAAGFAVDAALMDLRPSRRSVWDGCRSARIRGLSFTA